MENRAPVTRLALTVGDPEELAERLVPVTGPSRFSPAGRTFCGRVSVIILPRLSLFKIQVDRTQVTVPGPHAFFSTTLPLRAPIEVGAGRSLRTFDPGSAHTLNSSEELVLRTAHNGPLLVANFAESLLQALLGAREYKSLKDLSRGRAGLSLASPEGSAFYRELSGLWRELTGERPPSYPCAVLREKEEALGERFLRALRGQGAMSEERGGTVSASHLSRAEDYILSCLGDPLSVGKVAAALDVSSRTLSRAFRRRYGMSTHRFIMMRRLEAVHRNLLAADPGEARVGEIAVANGFTELGRFAGMYKKEFLESPSDTLHR